ncbi:MAG: hypothetical protein ACKO0Z_10295 [Betaproteobacteria bacterium]
MATTSKHNIKGAVHLSARKYDRQVVSAQICEELKLGRSLDSICRGVGMPSVGGFLEWVNKDDPPGIAADYAHAREIGYALLADEIVALSDKTHEWVTVHQLDPNGDPMYDEKGEPRLKKMLMPLNSDVIAHKRVQIDTRKWMLSKMLPKVYGDKITQEHTGADGGPIALAAVDLKNLSDDELENMSRLLAKAGGTK